MTKDRRISALEVLQRIKQQEIDGIGSRLTAIREKQSQIDRALCELRQLAITEANNTSPETLPFLPDFLKAIEQRSRLLAEQLNVLNEEGLSIEEELRSAFLDGKKNEVVLDIARQKNKLHEAQRETAEMTEIAMNVFLKRRNGS